SRPRPRLLPWRRARPPERTPAPAWRPTARRVSRRAAAHWCTPSAPNAKPSSCARSPSTSQPSSGGTRGSRPIGRERAADAGAPRRLGLVLRLALGRAAEAEAPLREAVRLQPTDAEAWVGLALTLGAQGRKPEALAAFDEARSHEPAILADRPAAAALF